MLDTNHCPCGSEKSLAECCLGIIKGKRSAKSAEDLLRARYTAFTLGEVDFILSSHHPKTREEVKREEIAEWAQGSEWQGLQIVHKEQGNPEDSKGSLVFCARYRQDGKDHEHWEKSYFEKDQGKWFFLDAHGIQQGTYQRTEPKIGRNDPCPCGSGKKYKKCCAA